MGDYYWVINGDTGKYTMAQIDPLKAHFGGGVRIFPQTWPSSILAGSGFRRFGLRVNHTWTPKVCRIIAFMAIIGGLRLSFYILLGFRYTLNLKPEP